MAQATASPQLADAARLRRGVVLVQIVDERVTLSWKTERVPRAQLEKMDADLRAAGLGGMLIALAVATRMV